MTSLPKLSQIPAEIVAVADYEAFARERMTPSAWAYLNGGAADELTLAENLAAFRRMRLLNRVLENLQGGHTRLRLCGLDLDYPILLAPVAFQRLARGNVLSHPRAVATGFPPRSPRGGGSGRGESCPELPPNLV